jgi:hypothetical protein
MTDIHSCSYYCDRPECIKAQRDELRDKMAQPKQEPVAWPCVIVEANFEQKTITLEMQCTDYKVGAGQHWLHTTQPAAQTNVGIGERGMEAYEAAKERGWVGLSDERLMEMPKQVFVAEIVSDANGCLSTRWTDWWTPNEGDKLYTTPPQRTWVGLTEEQRINISYKADGNECVAVELTEAKLKELNT